MATSVVLLIDLKLKPDMIDTTKQLLQAGLAEIRAFEGCQDATLLVNQEDVSNLTFVERWAGAGYGNRTRLAGLGSQSITTMLSPRGRLSSKSYTSLESRRSLRPACAPSARRFDLRG